MSSQCDSVMGGTLTPLLPKRDAELAYPVAQGVAVDAEQLASATKAAAIGITTPEGVLATLSESSGCAYWAVTPRDGGFSAEARSGVLCALAM